MILMQGGGARSGTARPVRGPSPTAPPLPRPPPRAVAPRAASRRPGAGARMTEPARKGRRSRPAADPEAAAREICLRHAAASPRTRAQLADALRRKGMPDEAAEAVLEPVHRRRPHRRRGVRAGMGRVPPRRPRPGPAGARRTSCAAAASPTRRSATPWRRSTPPRRRRPPARSWPAGSPSTRGVDPARRMRRLVGMLARKGYPAGLAYRVVREALRPRAPTGADRRDCIARPSSAARPRPGPA